MIKQHEQEVTKTETVIDDVICNCCGKSIHTDKTWGTRNDYLDYSKSCGYFSEHDTELHKCQICEDCCMKIASTFKIPVEVTEYM
jgi:ribosomal-protein-alanine N-acetyltransferase